MNALSSTTRRGALALGLMYSELARTAQAVKNANVTRD